MFLAIRILPRVALGRAKPVKIEASRTKETSMHAGAMGAAFALTIIAALPAIADSDALLVSPEIMQFYDGAYQRLKSPRAIAVAEDGFHFGYSYCPEYRCYMYPTARSLALQACAKADGRGCRVFAIDDEVQVSYRVIESRTLLETATIAPEEEQPTLPCVGKTREQCRQIAAYFAERQRQAEGKWAKIIDQKRRFYCTQYGAAPPCNVVKDAEAERNAELSSLDAELLRQLTH